MLIHSITPPKYWSFHPDTAELVGEGVCELSPARYARKHGPVAGHLKEPNTPIVPAYATLVEPPAAGPNQKPVWFEDHWELIADYRGEVRWNGEEFVVVTSLGDPQSPPLQVHDAQYVLPPGVSNDENNVRIRVWVNDSVIEIDDDPNQLPRQIVSKWEAAGETIRPIDEPEVEEADYYSELPQEEVDKRRREAIQKDLDVLAAKAVEG